MILYEFIGFLTSQVKMFLSFLTLHSTNFPFPTPTKSFGVVIARVIPISGSSPQYSFIGSHTLAPIPSQATDIHGFPFSSWVKTHPPSQGAFLAMIGFPLKSISKVCVCPFLKLSFVSKKMKLPSTLVDFTLKLERMLSCFIGCCKSI